MSEPVAPAPEPTTEPLAPASTPSAPPVDNASTADADELRKQLQKMEMERNLLRKQKDELERTKAERERKELEEKEDYRSLAERALAEAEALRKERDERETQASVQAITEGVFKDFDVKVVEIAKTAGISASGDSEEAATELRGKLEAIQGKLGTPKPATPTPNNPAPRVENHEETPFLRASDYKDNADQRAAAIWKNGRTASQRLKNSSAIAAMKQISGMEPQEI